MSFSKTSIAAALFVLTMSLAPAAQSSGPVTREQAQAIALEQSKGGTVVESETDRRRSGGIVYEFEILNNGVKYEVDIDAATGNIVKYKEKRKPFMKSGKAQPQTDANAAQEIAKARVGGGEVVEYDLDDDHGRLVHEITVRKDGVEYELEINDADGAILRYKID